MGPALDLAGFLLRGPDVCLENTMLSDLISNAEDRIFFLRKLQEPQKSSVLADSIHVKMRDGNNIQLNVEILSFEFKHLDGQPRHMIG
eukprot:CAMPEP_0171284238 /NCGR_PEP_ID=MMETSP0790-20130122/67837_1 /TAXON_ID=2925 /ORGANISM="Alexandrium catenella, Strain OF101" /LENGTH=87 /DNA_ID=CAMNT_0011753531 /DNA_START=60 /DNA_END=319 /DNA_ORIENTATION=+